jgi:hypothetical protein
MKVFLTYQIKFVMRTCFVVKWLGTQTVKSQNGNKARARNSGAIKMSMEIYNKIATISSLLTSNLGSLLVGMVKGSKVIVVNIFTLELRLKEKKSFVLN